MAENCGSCKHAIMAKGPNGVVDFNSKVCKARPPTVVLLPDPKGIRFGAAWPTVPNHERCGAWAAMSAAENLTRQTEDQKPS